MFSESRIMSGRRIPDIFHQFQGWMEVRHEVIEDICNGVYEIQFSPEPTATEIKTTAYDAPPESSGLKRKTEHKFQKMSKKSKTDTEGLERTQTDDDDDKYSNFERFIELLTGEDPNEKHLAQQKQKAKLQIFEEFFKKCEGGDSHPPEELECETDRLQAILRVLSKNREPALKEWINAYVENDVGAIEGSSSMNYCIFKKDEFGDDLRVPLEDYVQPSTSPPQLNKSSDDFLPDSQMISDSGVTPGTETISEIEMISDSEITPDDTVIPDSGIFESEVIPGNEDIPENNEDDKSDDEPDIFSFLSNPFGDQSVPDRMVESVLDKYFTASDPTLSDISVYGHGGIPDTGKISDSQQPLSFSVEEPMSEDDEYSIDSDKLIEFGLKPRQKYLTKPLVQSNDDDPSLYEPSTSSGIRKETAAKSMQENNVPNEKLCSYIEVSHSSDSKDQQTFSNTKVSRQIQEIPREENMSKNTAGFESFRYIFQNPDFFLLSNNLSPNKPAPEEKDNKEASEDKKEPAIVAISPPYQGPESLKIVDINLISHPSQHLDFEEYDDNQPDLI